MTYKLGVGFIVGFALLLSKCTEITVESKFVLEDGVGEDGQKYEKGPNYQSLRFVQPNLTDEESHGIHMPHELQCDGCRIIAYQFEKRFKKAHQRFKDPKKKLLETDVTEIAEKLCKDKFDGYGLKEVDGIKRLSGEGLETDHVPGMMQGGGRWPVRLGMMCDEYVGELGDDEIYKTFLSGKSMEDYLCRGEGVQGRCKPSTTKKKKKIRTVDTEDL